MTEVDAQKKPRIRTRMGLATVQIKEREREICSWRRRKYAKMPKEHLTIASVIIERRNKNGLPGKQTVWFGPGLTTRNLRLRL